MVLEKTWESLGLQGDQTSQFQRKSVLNIHWKDWCWSWNSNPDVENWLTGKASDAGKDWRREEKGMTEDEMVECHHRLDGWEFEQALGVGDGQGSLACCSPWDHKELHKTEWVNWTESSENYLIYFMKIFLIAYVASWICVIQWHLLNFLLNQWKKTLFFLCLFCFLYFIKCYALIGVIYQTQLNTLSCSA